MVTTGDSHESSIDRSNRRCRTVTQLSQASISDRFDPGSRQLSTTDQRKNALPADPNSRVYGPVMSNTGTESASEHVSARSSASDNERSWMATRTEGADPNGTPTGQKLTSITSNFEIDASPHDCFFETDTGALRDAFGDQIVEKPGLIRSLDDLFEGSIEEHS